MYEEEKTVGKHFSNACTQARIYVRTYIYHITIVKNLEIEKAHSSFTEKKLN